jgi:hypothetical protein
MKSPSRFRPGLWWQSAEGGRADYQGGNATTLVEKEGSEKRSTRTLPPGRSAECSLLGGSQISDIWVLNFRRL